ncbi:hypothetical protein CC86DRAFT_417683 [Ophiobolus disseminans]|uniref:DUF7932 domain-containing protein n=1 Tax=Ophiobolus disseminans TaxID=1469910 RepID=A0A6A7A126_9PLEO|nr:hypothetical protein CC86DRAFT_417683 [Ophiobolus disseminans]
MTTTISVNGPDGVTLARSSGIRLVHNDSQALVLRGQQPATRHGQPASNAPPAIPGGPAGTLAVQISESQLSQGAIHVQVVESHQSHRLPTHSEVPIGRDLRLTAIGGVGEMGHNGGNGEHGLDGVDGMPASQGSDATNGTNGGDGGVAGRGSNGADGGSGGDIHIIVDESSTHLLMSVSWDLKGGIGGRAGHHGNPGEGGTGGKGGMGWQWEEIVGYKYFCTDNCIKADAYVPTSALARVGSQLNAGRSHASASTMAMMAPLRARAVSGNNLERFIAQAAVAYNAVRTPRTDPGACKCGGGSGNCAGCDMKPIRHNFKRAPGLNGKDGELGASMTTPLTKGLRGANGTTTIAVQHIDGTIQRYTSAWALELVSFEVEDDNADGTFEPGEYVHIRRVTVRNVGGMPSPTVPIPVSLADHSDQFEEVSAEDGGVAYLPTSIPATGEASMEGSFKVRIKPNTIFSSTGTRFSERGWFQIRADMPWLEKRMPSFELRKEIDISYPCGFGDFDHLCTVAQSATSKITYKVQNFGNQPIGETNVSTERSPRAMEVSISMPHVFGHLVASTTGVDASRIDEAVGLIRPRDTITMQQQFRVLQNAENHKHFLVTFDLYLEAPEQQHIDMRDMVLVERRVVRLQVSSMYMRTPNAKVLLITNPKTTERESQAIQDFIQASLRMEVDLCNIHQNGGLLYLPEATAMSELEETDSILHTYRNKSIIFLNNAFNFVDCGERTSAQLCHSTWLKALATNNSSAFFIGTPKDSGFESKLRQSVLSIPYKCENGLKHVEQSRIFASPELFVEAVIQERKLGVLSTGLSAIMVKEKKWYHGRHPRAEREATMLTTYLNNHLPNERFVVTHDDMGHLLVSTGLPHRHSFRSIDSEIALQPVTHTNPTLGRLDRYSKFMIIATIPFHKRVDMMWRGVTASTSVSQAIQLSILLDLQGQIDNLQNSRSKKLLRIARDDVEDANTIVTIHIPFVADLLNHGNAKVSALPPLAVIHIFQWLLASARRIQRHRNLENIIILLLRSRPSTIQLLASPDFTAGISTNDPDKLLDQTSELTQTPLFILQKGQTSSRDVVPQTELLSPPQWDAIVAEIEEDRKRIADDMAMAKRELGKMVMEPVTSPTNSALELA